MRCNVVDPAFMQLGHARVCRLHQPGTRHLIRHCRQQPVRCRTYEELLEKARKDTLHPPSGQLSGRAGRRGILEDAERMLLCCQQMHPSALEPRMTLLENLLQQNRGREREVPQLVIAALRSTRLRHCVHVCDPQDAQDAVHCVELGLAALRKAGRQASMRRFVTDCIEQVPSLSHHIRQLAVHRFNVSHEQLQFNKRHVHFLTSTDDEDDEE